MESIVLKRVFPLLFDILTITRNRGFPGIFIF
jgi:hypothetical protein